MYKNKFTSDRSAAHVVELYTMLVPISNPSYVLAGFFFAAASTDISQYNTQEMPSYNGSCHLQCYVENYTITSSHVTSMARPDTDLFHEQY